MKSSVQVDRWLDVIVQEGLWSSKTKLRSYADYLFQEVDFEGRSILDIGGGTGIYSFYVVAKGAETVVCLEPDLSGRRVEIYRRLADRLGFKDVYLVTSTIQDFDASDQTFDIILSHNSINHLDEEACVDLLHSAEARDRYRTIFDKVARLSNPKAKLIVADNSRYNFFASLGVRPPWTPRIAWNLHQSPTFWSSLLREAGFKQLKIKWTTPGILGRLGRWLFANRLASYFLLSHFVLLMEKR